MLLALGLFAFGIDTLAFDEIQRKSSWRHATATRIGARDASQYTGPGDQTISLPGSVFTEIADGEEWLSEITRMGDTGDAWPLVDARGHVYATFVITSLTETMRAFWPDNTPRRIDFTIELLRVDEDPA